MYSDEQILERWWNIEDYAHDVWWACWAIYGWTCSHCWKTDTMTLYDRYLQEEWVRKIKEKTFNNYLYTRWWYDNVIDFLRKKKKTKFNRPKKLYKVRNIQEVIDYANTSSIDNAAKEFWISTRTVYRYFNLFFKD